MTEENSSDLARATALSTSPPNDMQDENVLEKQLPEETEPTSLEGSWSLSVDGGLQEALCPPPHLEDEEDQNSDSERNPSLSQYFQGAL